jgi:peptide chain release factor
VALPTQISRQLAALGWQSAEVEERFVRGAGPGGQKINKTSSTVWLRHRPTGVEVRCQRERSQTANRELAWAELCAKLEERSRVRAAQVQDERERTARRHRQKSPRQKARMIEAKKHRAGIKRQRGHVGSD